MWNFKNFPAKIESPPVKIGKDTDFQRRQIVIFGYIQTSGVNLIAFKVYIFSSKKSMSHGARKVEVTEMRIEAAERFEKKLGNYKLLKDSPEEVEKFINDMIEWEF